MFPLEVSGGPSPQTGRSLQPATWKKRLLNMTGYRQGCITGAWMEEFLHSLNEEMLQADRIVLYLQEQVIKLGIQIIVYDRYALKVK